VTEERRQSKKEQKIAILDAGSQFGGLIDRNVRELGLRTELLPLDTPIGKLKKYAAIIISGGPKSVEDADAYLCDPDLFSLDKPILGICYGLQLMAKLLGGSVGPGDIREDGPMDTVFIEDSALFEGFNGTQRVLMTHGDSVQTVPEGYVVSGRSGSLISAIENPARKHYGVQFHPEVFQTVRGVDIFRNFLFNIAGLTPDYTIDDLETEVLEHIKSAVGTRDVVVFVSGGVDSAVLAALIGKAIPKLQIHAFHIDTGFMRQGESEQVISALKAAGIDVVLLDMADMFATATTIIGGQQTLPLNQMIDPQTKRKIIGDTFIAVRDKILRDYNLAEDSVLAQGSLRPDLIESGSVLASSKADTIKTHHNDTEEVRKLRQLNRVVEPLQELYKDQVRALGRRLGLPDSLIERHPFPGPGLAIRVLCAEQPYRLDNHEQLQQQLDDFVQHTSPNFQATLLPVQTVGVQGDGRSYKYLTGLTGPAKWDELYQLAASIPNHNHATNRVCYIFGEPIDRQNLQITPTHLTKPVLEQLRQADAIVGEVLHAYDLFGNFNQLPVISFPVNFGQKDGRAIALRPFKTPDFMTGVPGRVGEDFPEVALQEIINKILTEVPGIARVAIDLTSKPPGTTEWE